ncbi:MULTISPECIES: phosphoenolpyruvate carboxykinase (ATP) [Paenibacillus]|uniref:phosphoenolpyruvate carboxykinase (ATP) n=1 Tax=Paenibacillus TaxID=44249 RepID=UPI0022B92110|nr:phosphoenolpyruvate carboxykinase (ATP) [Paenibacillus caseinilyticus]MCZ8520812.1 phosphoenolpyruvate carboxykinase (ATP) [Paenibacillus caseinilyticus]
MAKRSIDLTTSELIHQGLGTGELIEEALRRKEGMLTSTGALRVDTGAYTGRSPKDKYIVNEPAVQEHIDWGNVNRPLEPERFERLYLRALQYAGERETYVFDGYAGADPAYRLRIRVRTEYAWHNLFARQLFIRPAAGEAAEETAPDFTVLALPGLRADPERDGTRSETFIVISFEKRIVLIGGTEYAGEMKKSIFSVLNYLLPLQGVLPMHCSASVGEEGETALFYGLSGTGKTTLSADPSRRLLGDDEHGWSDRGVFNFEGGCYAKCIGLSEAKEPQIWQAIRHGAVLENVAVNPFTREADYASGVLTENTRAAYPLDHIPGAVEEGIAGHPGVVIFLTADASGVLPPIAKLTKEQAMYHFLSGYTSKLAGTERGVTEPEAVFSACFGAPFLPLKPEVYAQMLGSRIDRHGVRVYLVNTGWTGGPYGTGSRMKLAHTRAMVAAALDGSIEEAVYTADPVFGLQCPDRVAGVPADVLQPRRTWEDGGAYDAKAAELAAAFHRNFAKFGEVSEDIRSAGPIAGR